MKYSATNPSGHVPLLEGPTTNYKHIRKNSSFDFLEVSVNKCSTYVPNGWLHIYPTDGHVLSSVFIPMGMVLPTVE